MHALDPKQGLQAVEQEIVDARYHLALDRRTLDVIHQVDDPKLVQEVEGIIQQRAFIQPVDAVDHLLAVQPPRHP